MGLFGTILGAVAGPIAGLFKKDKPQVTENRVDYKRMVKDAQAAGFNPLTVLRNGGSAGFSTQIHHPALSSGGIGDLIATGISAAASYDPMAEQSAELQYRIVQEQLKQLQNSNKAEQRRNSFAVPTYTGASGRVSPGGFVASTPVASSAGSTRAGSPAQVTDPWTGPLLGGYLTVNKGISDADTFEQRYADIGSNIMGLGIAVADAYASAKRAYDAQSNPQKAVAEAKKVMRDLGVTGPRADKAADAFAKGSMPTPGRYYTPDLGTLRRGMVGTW